VRETLAEYDGLADFAFAMQGLGSGAISIAGSDALKSRYLPKVASGRAIKKAIRFTSETKAEIFEFIEAHRQVNRISTMCRVYAVTRGGYYAWHNRPLARSKRENERVLERIRRIHADSNGSYGSPRIHAVESKFRAAVACVYTPR
jgi:hypothetical protein